MTLPNANRDNPNYGSSPTLNPKCNAFQGTALEFIATFVLVMMVFTGIRTKKSEHVMGMYVGLTLFTMINAIGAYTGASLNPARTIGPFTISNGFVPFDSQKQPFTVYYLGPILGGICAGLVSKYVIYNDETLKVIKGPDTGKSNITLDDSNNYGKM